MNLLDRAASFLDRVVMSVSPQWGQSRARARLATRHYEAAAVGRRTDGWHRLGTDANAAAAGATLSRLRAQARDLVRNNPWARRGLRRIVVHTVGWGIRPKATGRGAELVMDRWKRWAETTQCDASGRLTMYGLQRLAMRTIVESGEVLIRRRWRRPTDGLAVPMQLQVLEPDFIDTSKDGIKGIEGGDIIQGVEFDAIGRRVAYWLFDQHPGGLGTLVSPVSRRIPADGILHVYDQERAGQGRGVSWFASVDARLHDFDEFEDATLMKQKIAACMAVFVSDAEGLGSPIGRGDTDAATGQATDTFEPGMVIPLPPGKQVTVANPPQASDHQSFSTTTLRGVAAGLGTTYEDLTGDYSQVNYSSARMSRLAHQGDVHDWRWNMLIPQFCAPAWEWMLTALLAAGEDIEAAPAEWSPAPMPILDPEKEAAAYKDMIRIGGMTWAQMVRELGEDPTAQLAEIEATNKELDRRGVVLDSDPRKMTAAGQQQAALASGGAAVTPSGESPTDAAPTDDGEDKQADEENPVPNKNGQPAEPPKVYQYHLPVMRVNEVRQKILLAPDAKDGSLFVGEWLEKHGGALASGASDGESDAEGGGSET